MKGYEKQIIKGVSVFMFLLLLAGCASTASGTSYSAGPTGVSGSSAQAMVTETPAATASVKVASLSIGNVLVNQDEMFHVGCSWCFVD